MPHPQTWLTGIDSQATPCLLTFILPPRYVQPSPHPSDYLHPPRPLVLTTQEKRGKAGQGEGMCELCPSSCPPILSPLVNPDVDLTSSRQQEPVPAKSSVTPALAL